jgi:hypothetical protein
MKDITIEELDEALTIACRDRDAYAADLRAAEAEVERLRAELAEAQAVFANEYGEGPPPEPGWVWAPVLRQWTYYHNEKPCGFVLRVADGRWAWGTWGPKGRCGFARTARAGIREATRAFKASVTS